MTYLEKILFFDKIHKIRALYDDSVIFLNSDNYSRLLRFFNNERRNINNFKFAVCEKFDYRLFNYSIIDNQEIDSIDNIFLDVYSKEDIKKNHFQVLYQFQLINQENCGVYSIIKEINFEEIEKALGFNLNFKQKDYLKNKVNLIWERGEGHTTAYIIDILLNYRLNDIKIVEIPEYTDRPNDFNYSTKYFRKIFLEIYAKLKDNAFVLRRVID